MSSSGPPWPAAITIRSWYSLILNMVVSVIVCALVAIVLRAAQVPVIAAYTVTALGGILLVYRTCRHGVRFDDRGITVRNLYRTHKLSWHDVSRFADGEVFTWQDSSMSQYLWAVRIVLNSGRSVTAEGTMRMEKRAVSEVLATMKQVAARWQIPAAHLRGTDPGSRPG